MQLYGYATRRSALGLQGAFVPLGELTVLLGANDAGKSTLLAALDEDLRGGPPPPVGDEMVEAVGALFVTVGPGELDRLLPRAPRPSGPLSGPWPQGGYDPEVLDRPGLGRDPQLESYLDRLCEASVSPASFKLVLQDADPVEHRRLRDRGTS